MEGSDDCGRHHQKTEGKGCCRAAFPSVPTFPIAGEIASDAGLSFGHGGFQCVLHFAMSLAGRGFCRNSFECLGK